MDHQSKTNSKYGPNIPVLTPPDLQTQEFLTNEETIPQLHQLIEQARGHGLEEIALHLERFSARIYVRPYLNAPTQLISLLKLAIARLATAVSSDSRRLAYHLTNLIIYVIDGDTDNSDVSASVFLEFMQANPQVIADAEYIANLLPAAQFPEFSFNLGRLAEYISNLAQTHDLVSMQTVLASPNQDQIIDYIEDLAANKVCGLREIILMLNIAYLYVLLTSIITKLLEQYPTLASSSTLNDLCDHLALEPTDSILSEMRKLFSALQRATSSVDFVSLRPAIITPTLEDIIKHDAIKKIIHTKSLTTAFDLGIADKFRESPPFDAIFSASIASLTDNLIEMANFHLMLINQALHLPVAEGSFALTFEPSERGLIDTNVDISNLPVDQSAISHTLILNALTATKELIQQTGQPYQVKIRTFTISSRRYLQVINLGMKEQADRLQEKHHIYKSLPLRNQQRSIINGLKLSMQMTEVSLDIQTIDERLFQITHTISLDL